MSELFLEIGVEEIPVAEINPAIEHISGDIRRLLESEQITFKEIKTFSTPRRLALFIDELADKGKPSITTYTGPRKESAFDKDGNPTQAAIGFARSKGIDVKLLKVVKLDKGEFVQAQIKNPGIRTNILIKQNLEKIILNSPFKKSMRWGGIENSSNGSSIENNSKSLIRFIRPIRWLVVLYNGKVIPILIGDVKASSYTHGLRIGSVKKIKIAGYDSWLKAMGKEKILPDVAIRRKNIMMQAEGMTKHIKGKTQSDIELLDAITNLVESPMAILGSFDKRFMNLPQEVIMSVMKIQQKYIPVMDEKLALMPYFVGISNNPHGNKTVIRKGYERVLTARLEDAEFYYREDIKQPLEAYVDLLKGMVYNPALGSIYDKTQRIEAIASYLCDEIKIDESLKGVTLEAARLCKADLATRLVSEFPELQGIIGRQYIQNSRFKIQDLGTETQDLKFNIQNSESRNKQIIADAVYEHSSKDVPQTLPGAVVSIADKIDTLVGFFSIGEVPTGTQDPYGLRRATIGIINTILNKSIRINIKKLIEFSFDQYAFPKMPINYPSYHDKWDKPQKDAVTTLVLNYIYGRLEGILKERYYKKLKTQNSIFKIQNEETQDSKQSSEIDKLINAVLATEPNDIYEANQRIDALKNIVFKPEFEPVLLAFKRVINISKEHLPGDIVMELLIEEPEKALYDSYLNLQTEIRLALAKTDYIGYINVIHNLVEPINTFFDKVLVMSDNEKIRTNRLNMLAKIKNLVMQVLNITKLT